MSEQGLFLVCVLLLCCAAPYSKLSGLFKGTFMAGYAFNPHTHSIRVYLSTEQPGAEPGGSAWHHSTYMVSICHHHPVFASAGRKRLLA